MITIDEKWDSPTITTGDNPAIEHHYLAQGDTNFDNIKWAALSGTPLIDTGLMRQTVDVKPAEEGADSIWDVTVKYGRKRQWQTGESEWYFDTTGGSEKITQSLNTTSYAASGPAPDFRGAINVTRDAVEGVEITLPKFGFGETHYIASGMVTFGYAFALRQLTGTVNQSAFRAFAPGEVLFLGASGRMRGQEDWEISYKFAASPNKTGLSVGAITGIVKRGWDYLWVRYQDDVDTTANAIVRRPLAVYVEQVYTYADWSPMGIY